MRRDERACLRVVRPDEWPADQLWAAPAIRHVEQPRTRLADGLADAHSAVAPKAPPLTVEPIPAPAQPPAADQVSRWLGVAAAIAAHCVVLIAFLLADAPEPSGGGGQELEAISVDIVLTRVLEARDTVPKEVAPAAQGPVAAVEGDRAEPVEAVQVQPQQIKPEQPEHIMKSEAPDAEVAMVEEVKPTKAEPEPKVTLTPEEKPHTPAPEARSQGGVAALTAEGQTRASAPASASAGAVQRYGMQVRAALARNKPDGRGTHGTASITFAIAPSGKLKFARLATSSGNAALDKAALAAVQRTSFPPPPPLMTETQLTYIVPFHFK